MSDLFDGFPRDRHRGGVTYQQAFDFARLNGQQRAVWDAVKDGFWRSLAEIALCAGAPDFCLTAFAVGAPRHGCVIFEKWA